MNLSVLNENNISSKSFGKVKYSPIDLSEQTKVNIKIYMWLGETSWCSTCLFPNFVGLIKLLSCYTCISTGSCFVDMVYWGIFALDMHAWPQIKDAALTFHDSDLFILTMHALLHS